MKNGFSLVELSIVLVILGLLTGGVLAGQSLIRAAEMRAQISQIQLYQVGTKTFRDKYFALPGDLAAATATQLGFTTRSGSCARGDGNGVVEGYNSSWGCAGTITSTGETALFWSDLSRAGLIEGGYTTASASVAPVSDVTNVNLYFPPGKMSNTDVYVWSGGKGPGNASAYNGINYFGLTNITLISASEYGYMQSAPSMSVVHAWNIDKKIDDGLPMNGKITAQYVKYSFAPLWVGIAREDDPTAIALNASSGTCIDNGGVIGAIYQYTYSAGDNPNCALSIQFN